MTEVRRCVDRVRVEVEYDDGQVRVVELVGQDAEKVQLSLAVEAETRELPPTLPYRRWEPSGRMRVKLDAFGTAAAVARRGQVGESSTDQAGTVRTSPEEPAGQTR